MKFTGEWIELGKIILSKVSQAQKDIYYMNCLYVLGLLFLILNLTVSAMKYNTETEDTIVIQILRLENNMPLFQMLRLKDKHI